MRNGIFGEDSSEVHWLAGLVAADGCVLNARAWTLTQSGDDGRATIDRVRLTIGHTSKVYEHQPKRGRLAHTLYVPSPQMVSDLATGYGVTPRKSLTYGWPSLHSSHVADFMAGFIDGDGCISVYPTPQGEPFLHLSYVGTPDFIEGSSKVIPSRGRIRRLPQCKNLAEIRFNGRHACDAAAWIYASPVAQLSRKYKVYKDHVSTAHPVWKTRREQREAVREALLSGMSLRSTARHTGVSVSTVCAWKAQFQVEPNATKGQDDDVRTNS